MVVDGDKFVTRALDERTVRGDLADLERRPIRALHVMQADVDEC